MLCSRDFATVEKSQDGDAPRQKYKESSHGDVPVIETVETKTTALNTESTHNSLQPPSSASDIAREKRKIWRNVIVINISYFLSQTSFMSLAHLQSSLHGEDGLGVISQAVLFASYSISCLFLIKPTVAALGHKWVLVVGYTGFIIWMASNGYAVWGTMITSSVIAGFSSTVYPISQTYLNKMAGWHAEITGTDQGSTASLFLSISVAALGIGKIDIQLYSLKPLILIQRWRWYSLKNY